MSVIIVTEQRAKFLFELLEFLRELPTERTEG
jgi:hypothetical protein